jgi:hypothetical protein
MLPLFAAAMVVLPTCCLLALAYGVAALLHRFGAATNAATKLVFGAAGGVTLVGVIGVPIVVLGPELMRPWPVLAYFGWLFVLAVLTSAVLVPPLFFERRRS